MTTLAIIGALSIAIGLIAAILKISEYFETLNRRIRDLRDNHEVLKTRVNELEKSAAQENAR